MLSLWSLHSSLVFKAGFISLINNASRMASCKRPCEVVVRILMSASLGFRLMHDIKCLFTGCCFFVFEYDLVLVTLGKGDNGVNIDVGSCSLQEHSTCREDSLHSPVVFFLSKYSYAIQYNLGVQVFRPSSISDEGRDRKLQRTP